MLRTRVLTALILGPVVLAVAWFREPWLSPRHPRSWPRWRSGRRRIS